MHDDAEADGGVEAPIRKIERVRVADEKPHGCAYLGGATPRDGQHFARGVDRGHGGALAGQP